MRLKRMQEQQEQEQEQKAVRAETGIKSGGP
jgi:hypothetical protein